MRNGERLCQQRQLGEQFLPYAENIKKAHDEAASFAAGVVEDSNSPMVKEVRIGVATMQFVDFLPAMISHMKAEMPEVRLLVTDGFQAYVLQQLKEDKLDVILTEGHSLENQEGVDSVLLRRSNMKLLAPATHPLAQKKELVSLKELSEFKLPLLSADVTLTSLVKKMVDGEIDIQYFQSTTMAASLVEAGFGIAICREELLKLFSPNLVYLDIEERLHMEATVAWMKDDGVPAWKKKFLGEMSTFVKEYCNRCSKQ